MNNAYKSQHTFISALQKNSMNMKPFSKNCQFKRLPPAPTPKPSMKKERKKEGRSRRSRRRRESEREIHRDREEMKRRKSPSLFHFCLFHHMQKTKQKQTKKQASTTSLFLKKGSLNWFLCDCWWLSLEFIYWALCYRVLALSSQL